MKSRRKYDLKSIQLDEISLVDNPANADARVSLWKRDSEVSATADADAGTSGDKPTDNQGDQSMDVKELGEKLEGLEKQVAQLEADKAEISKARDDAEAKLAEAVAKKADEPEMVEFNGEKIEKSAVPAPVLKALEEQQAEITKMREAAQLDDLRKQADEVLPNLSGSAELRGSILKAVDGIEGAVDVLKGADKAVKFAMTEQGFTKSAESSALDELDKLAKDYAAEKNVGYHEAYAEVTKSGRGAELFAKRNAN